LPHFYGSLVDNKNCHQIKRMDKYSIDYSKWDRMVDSDDEDDEKESAKPRVTVLDQPTRVTFGGSGGGQSEDIDEAEAASPSLADTKERTAIPFLANASDPSETKPLSKYGIPQSWSEKGSVILKRPEDASSAQSSFQNIHYCWSQDRASVHIRVPIDGTTTAKEYDVAVTNVLPYRDRHCAVLTNAAPLQLVVRHGKSDVPLLSGTLSHPVYVTEDDDGVVDWSIETMRLGDSEERYILILLNKATPMDGVTLWWKQCLQEETERAALPPATPQQVALQEAWKEAHAQFRETVATRTKHTV
jgi:hypothetical protein